MQGFKVFKVLLSFWPLGARKRSYIRTRHSLCVCASARARACVYTRRRLCACVRACIRTYVRVCTRAHVNLHSWISMLFLEQLLTLLPLFWKMFTLNIDKHFNGSVWKIFSFDHSDSSSRLIWPRGKELGWYAHGLGFCSSALLFLQILSGSWPLSCDLDLYRQTKIKYIKKAANLNAKLFWWWRCIVRYIVNLFSHLLVFWYPASISLYRQLDVKQIVPIFLIFFFVPAHNIIF